MSSNHQGGPRRNIAQGGGSLVSPVFGGDERSEPKTVHSIPVDLHATSGGRAADARGARAAAALPCLNTINCNERKEKDSRTLSAGHRKTAFALMVNVLALIERHGLERIGFLTLTFKRHVVAYREAQKSLHSLMTGVLKPRYCEFITVMERMDSKRIHYHLLVVMAEDIRTGFDFAAVKRGDYRSASNYLRREWKFWRETAPRYRFGRTELLPIRKTAEGVAKYVGKYVAKHIGQRLPEDKGARLVRYSQRANRVGTRFSWASQGARLWRFKLGAFCGVMRLTPENFRATLKEWFGKSWVHHLRPVIESIKLPEFYSEEESKASLKAVWLTTVNERERRQPRRRDKPLRPPSQSQPAPAFPSWIERTAKEDA